MATNAGHDNIKPPQKGEVRNPKGKPPGTRNRSTIAREWLATSEKTKNPITKAEAELSQEDIMTLALVKKARSGDVAAYKALMDSAYGAPKQDITSDGEALKAPVIQIIKPQ